MNRVIKCVFTIHLLLLVSLSGYVSAQASDKGACTVLSYNGGDHLYPYFIRNEPERAGIAPELLQLAGKRLDQAFVGKKAVPWKRVLLELKYGKLHFLAGLLGTQEYQEQFRLSTPISIAEAKVFVRSDRQFSLSRYEDLQDLRGGKILGASFGEEFDQFAFENLVLDEVLDTASLFKMLEVGRVDYILLLSRAGQHYLQQHKKRDTFVMLNKVIATRSVHIAMSKTATCQLRMREVMKELERLQQEGDLEEIEKRYLSGKKTWREVVVSSFQLSKQESVL